MTTPLDTATCPECGGKAKIYDSRPHTKWGFAGTIRRRKCVDCGNTWAAVEIPVEVAKDMFADD